MPALGTSNPLGNSPLIPFPPSPFKDFRERPEARPGPTETFPELQKGQLGAKDETLSAFCPDYIHACTYYLKKAFSCALSKST